MVHISSNTLYHDTSPCIFGRCLVLPLRVIHSATKRVSLKLHTQSVVLHVIKFSAQECVSSERQQGPVEFPLVLDFSDSS